MKNNLLQKILSRLIAFSLIVNLILSNALSYTAYAQEVISDPPAPTQSEEIQQASIPAEGNPTPDVSSSPSTDSNPTLIPAVDVQENANTEISLSPTLSPTPTEEKTAETLEEAETVLEETILTQEPAVTPEPAAAPEINETPSSENVSLDATVDLSPSPIALPSANSLWSALDGTWATTENVELNKDYTAPQNDKVKITFTKLPEASGKLTIKEIKLTNEQVEQTKALSDTVYDITSTMIDGTFEYNLTLPIPLDAKDKDIEIKSAENTDQLSNAQKVEEPKEKTSDTITIKGLNHFTVFVITAPDPDTTQKVLINEVVPNAGTEWIELFNNSTVSINLANGTGWTIRNSANNTLSLSSLGTIAPSGRVVFEPTPNWLSDSAPETITLSNELGTTVDTIIISLTAPGFAISHYPLANESVGRKTDGVTEWIIFTSPTKGTVNAIPLSAEGLADVSEINPENGYPTWYKDSMGVALQLCLAGDNGLADGNCTLPEAGEEPNFDPADPVSFPDNFPGEAFWYLAEPDAVTNAGQTGQGRVKFRYALESAFTTEVPTENEQIAFLRINLQPISDLVPGADYIVTHPFGQFTIHADATGVADDGRFFRVEDGAFAPPLTHDSAASILPATSTHISKFLKQVSPVPPAGYIGDGSLSTIEEGPNGNFVRVEGPSIDVNNYDGDGDPNSLTINTWTVSGKLAGSTAPVITLFGANPVNVNQNSTYIDAGATALDDADGNLTGSIIVTGLPVDTSTLGAKTVTYTVSDSIGNATVVTRTVNVVAAGGVDATFPVITIIGANPASVVAGTPYIDAGATAIDNVDGDLTAGIITTGLPVNTSVAGTHTVVYNVSDAAGNAAVPATRIVNVTADTTAPVISIIGSNPVHVFVGQTYTDAGATALDNVDGNLTAGIITTGLPIDTSVAGTHTVTYSVTDTSGNIATAARTVIAAAVLPAGLVETGPIAPAGGLMAGFPSWYKDSNGLALDLMEASDGFGISDPVDPANPFSQTIGFNAEGFWWSAEAAIDNGSQTGLLVLAVEAAFAGEAAVDGEQSVQNRVRYRLKGLVPGETYIIHHPYGNAEEVADEVGVINVTDDTGCFAGGGVTCNQLASPNFSTLLSGQVGPYLTWDTFGQAVTDPLLINSANPGRRYVGNPGIEHKVTGSPIGQNSFSVTGPGLSNFETDLFAVSGRLAEVLPPSTEEDVVAPVITIIGANPANVNVGEVYTDAGATALDNVDGNITANIITTGLPIDTSAVGTFTVTYNVSDAAGNAATPVIRTVNVAAIPPVPTPSPVPSPIGTITIVENAIPNDSQDFGFRLRNDAIDERFSLDDDGDAVSDLSNAKTFLDLAPGLYSLEQNSASNWVLDIVCEDEDNGTTVDINAGKASIDLDSGENITCTFVNSLKRSITGAVFNDLNINGIKDTGEIGLLGWTIFLDANDNGILDSGEVSALTDANGNYQFLDLAGGTYNIAEVLQENGEQTAPTGGKHTVTVNSNNSLINQDFGNIRFYAASGFGRFVSTSGTSLTSSVISRGISTISVLANGGTSSVIIPDGTVISRVDGSSFNIDELLASVPSSNILAGLETSVVDGVLQWGIPNVELQFSSPVTLSIFVGNSLNGQTLDVRRSVTGSSWTTDGIIAPATCLVASALCTFQATKASFYVAMHSVPVPTPAASSDTTSASTSSTGGNSSNAASASVCNDSKPGSAPVLLSVIASGLGQATLTWSKALDPVTYYLIGYGTTPGQFEFGTPNIGGKDTASYTISGLSDAANYYFKVRAGNGCMPGEFSNEIAIRPLDAIFATNTIDLAENSLGIGGGDQDKTEVLGAAKKKEAQIQAGIISRNFITSNPVIAAIIVLILSFLALNSGSLYRKLRRN